MLAHSYRHENSVYNRDKSYQGMNSIDFSSSTAVSLGWTAHSLSLSVIYIIFHCSARHSLLLVPLHFVGLAPAVVQGGAHPGEGGHEADQ